MFNPFGCLGAFLVFFASGLMLSTLAATAPLHPIVDAQTGYLLGASQNGNWVRDKAAASAITSGENYRVYGVSTLLGKTTGSKTRTNEAPCDETHWVRLQRNYNGVLAVGGAWNATPRKPRPQNLQQKIYRDEVARVLKENGIKNPKVVITQLWRIDLDGDKTEEVLLAATNHSTQNTAPKSISPNAQAGEYSLVLMRKVINGKAQTIMLAQEYYPQAKTFNAPNVHRLLGAYDLNGDGKMEVVVNSRYYEGDAVSVFEIKNNAATEVLSSGCGA